MKNSIHFLGTGYSDCIILESDGKFAMIDAAEDTDYPENKPHLKFPGYEQKVVEYLNQHCQADDGKVYLEFVLGTHAHSDHIGGFDTVILQDNVVVQKAYLKPYVENGIIAYERKRWDNTEVYTQMKNALEQKGIPIVESFDREQISLGSFRLTLFNGKYIPLSRKTGENRNSVVTLAECDGKRALLSGDMNYSCGGEKQIADAVGKIDLMKVGHHGYIGSTSKYWIKKLDPDYAVICNYKKRVSPDVMYKIIKIARAQMLCTGDIGGVKFDMNNLSFETGIM